MKLNTRIMLSNASRTGTFAAAVATIFLTLTGSSLIVGCSSGSYTHHSYRPIRIGTPTAVSGNRVTLNAPAQQSPTPKPSNERAMFHATGQVAAIRTAPAASTIAHHHVMSNPPMTAQYKSPSTPLASYPEPWQAVSAPKMRHVQSPPMRQRPTERSAGRTSLISLYGNELISQPVNSHSAYASTTALRQISLATEGSTFDPDIDPQGEHVVFASTRHRPTSDIYIQSTSGTTVTQLTSDLGQDIMPVFHPNGKKIAFASDRHGNWDIFVLNLDGGRPVQITTDNDDEMHATWSPDGRTLCYCRFGSQTGRWEIWSVSVENPGVPSFLTYGVFPQWTPDIMGNKILFQRARERGSQFHSIWTIDYVDGEALRPTEIVSAANAALINPAWSPDGQHVVFVSVVDPSTTPSGEPVQSDVWVVSINGTGRTNLTNGQFANFQPVWSPTGSVYFVSNRSGVDNIWSIRATDWMEPMQDGASGFATAESDTTADQP